MPDDDGDDFTASGCPGWHEEWELSEADAEFLRNLLKAPPGSPGRLPPDYVPKPIPPADPGIVR